MKRTSRAARPHRPQRFEANAVAQLLHARQHAAEHLRLTPLDGGLMSNPLHVVRDPAAVLARVAGDRRPGGRFFLVDGAVPDTMPWLPSPFLPRAGRRWPRYRFPY